MIVYRDAFGRFSQERCAVSKQSGDQLFIWLFGRWVEAKPITVEVMRDSAERLYRSMQAMAN
jgi:hypothetical protein